MRELKLLAEGNLAVLQLMKKYFESRFFGLYRFRQELDVLRLAIEHQETLISYMTIMDSILPPITYAKGTPNVIVRKPNGPKES